MANCAGCVHYVHFEGDIGGECAKVGAPIKGALAHVECPGDCSCDSATLVVMPDFGCVHFEPRDKPVDADARLSELLAMAIDFREDRFVPCDLHKGALLRVCELLLALDEAMTKGGMMPTRWAKGCWRGDRDA